MNLGPQKMPASFGRLKAQAAQLVRQQEEAQAVRKEWLTLMGLSEEEIAEQLDEAGVLSLPTELEQLAAIKRVKENL